VDEATRRELLLGCVTEHTARLLGVGADDIDVAEGFFQMGMDSMMAVDLRQAIEKDLGTTLPGTVLFEQPTAMDLVDYLLANADLAGTGEPAAGVVSVSTGRAATFHEPIDDSADEPPWEDLSEDDLLALLNEEIDLARTVREMGSYSR
jgi:acyl carrier protein